ncbi:glycoside hydrolase family 68 protein [Salipaludibacillus agaradhaerens]|uniref:glycoside hydrolase family 68 protein n=1 Tax=Salipaludibacillus agaradhaerens TaxID=76935 RepID=UPI00215108AC|nr:glycoside hydrolase family 68 protein [Salipaludibacillus agaradhaerens]MCR6105625.1 glycoside hydrolase family 68 protein [Salipaludibacillus agaradhaerens]MCR6117662.1 glycoside hydrolase family 68 protein [Salipaludibacillus agaradhaerens]UJW56849.1 glycoside hydrolase family 68 protein [Bacillus sp. A116_S68]
MGIKKTYGDFLKWGVCTAILGSSLMASTVFATSDWDAEDDYTAVWTRQQAENVALTKDTTAPLLETDEDFELVAPDKWVWDTWPLQNRDGSLAQVNGYTIAFALVAPRDLGWGERHTEARIGMFYSKDGKDWTYAGIPYDYDKAYGHMQWAGSAMLDNDGKVHFFYTATGRKDNSEYFDQPGWEPMAEQRLAKTTFDISADKDGVHLTKEDEHQIMLEADGEYYETLGQWGSNGNIISAFRDPFFFQDPNTGEEYIIWEGQAGPKSNGLKPENIGDEAYRKNANVPDRAELYNGNIGIAKVLDEDVSELKMLPPLLESIGVNHQLERPHVVVDGDTYYLLTISHTFTYAPGLTGPEGLYGFVNEGGLRGDYEPLNDGGLVIGNPAESPGQAYSWWVAPDGQVISFINEPLDENGEVQFVGTFAPTLQLSFDGDQTKIEKEMGYGEIRPFGAYR